VKLLSEFRRGGVKGPFNQLATSVWFQPISHANGIWKMLRLLYTAAMVCVVAVDKDDVIWEGFSGERLTSNGRRESMPMEDNIYA
jgi:hypothetical protein